MSRGASCFKRYTLDCGIAMLHIEVAALHRDIKGEWEFLESPEVARFRFKN